MNVKISKILIALMLPMLILSCKKSDTTTTKSTNTSVSSFSIKHVRLEIDTTKTFVIDDTLNLIYNVDSLPFQTPIDSLTPTISGSLLSKVLINDTIEYTGKDTVNFSQPVTLTSYAENGENTQKYTVKVNVHTVDPDRYVWQKTKQIYTEESSEEKAFGRNDSLFWFVKTDTEIFLLQSTDGRNWDRNATEKLPKKATLRNMILANGEFLIIENDTIWQSKNGKNWKGDSIQANIKTLLFELNGKIFARGNDSLFASTDKKTWQNVAKIPENFPVKNAAILVAKMPNGAQQVFVVGGEESNEQAVSTVWSSNDGIYWTELTEGKGEFHRKCAALIQYDGKLMLIGGRTYCQLIVGDPHYVSSNWGLTWKQADEKTILPVEQFGGRCCLSAVVDSKNNIYLIGGRDFITAKKDVFIGKKNQFSFIIR